MKSNACILCGSTNFKDIPAVWEQSMTTAGRLVSEPLAKAQCSSCGLLQRVRIRHLGETEFYERHYSFYERPGAATFDLPRYRAMANWIRSSLPTTFAPRSILDAGCGRGWMMDAMREVFPKTTIDGIEPSEQESQNARGKGYSVITAKIETNKGLVGNYDLVYSTNVVEHTMDPIDFLKSLKALVADDGCILLTCPDSSCPSAEFMFSDQNYSFTPSQLIEAGRQAGLHLIAWKRCPATESLLDKQLVMFSKSHQTPLDAESDTFSDPDYHQLYVDRCDYVEKYVACDEYLCAEIGTRTQEVYNFGTSTWSLLLSAYCPDYWIKVTYCVIDGGRTEFQGKKVLNFAHMNINEADSLILGVNPSTQPEFFKRFKSLDITPIGWNHIIPR
jgi:SAM-dependent methyltransferase